MRTNERRLFPGLKATLLGVIFLALSLPLSAQTVTQTFNLRPGWNAIFLEVTPPDPAPSAVFGSIPNLQSVWMWNGRQPERTFVANVTEAVVVQAGWLSWFPGSLTFLSDLYAVRAHKAFLINFSGSTPQTLSVTGVPTTRPIEWIPDSLNLRGFAIDPANKPTFASYLATSPAHAGRNVYTLDAPGVWRLVNAQSETIVPGVAYWFDVAGSSTFQGPLSVTFDGGDSLEFGQTLDERTLTASTTLGTNGSIAMRVTPAPNTIPLRYFALGANSTITWPALPNPYNLTVAPNSNPTVRLAVNRSSLPADRVTSLLEVKTSAGGRWVIPIAASRTNSAATSIGLAARLGADAAATDPFAGLWAGTVTVTKVSNSQNTSTTTSPTQFPFTLRLLLHVDGSGSVKLLKEVTQMFQTSTGHDVLVTKDDKIASYSGSTLRDGVQAGRRLSTAGFDFSGDALSMTGGSMGTSSVLSGVISIPASFPTNPYRHKFHPDHNNSDPVTTFDITRTITLTFSATDPEGSAVPGFGTSAMGGKYEEKLAGVHKNDIYVEGTFRLQRVSLIDTLNP